MAIGSQLGNIKRSIGINNMRFPQQKKQGLRRQPFCFPPGNNRKKSIRQLLGDFSLSCTGQLIQFSCSILRMTFLKVYHCVA